VAVAGAAGAWGPAGRELEARPEQRTGARAGEQELRVDGAVERVLAARLEKPVAQVVAARLVPARAVVPEARAA
jgi:hypothetical protein